MQWNFQEIHQQAQAEAQAIDSSKALEVFRLKYLGKKGLVAAVCFPRSPAFYKAAIGKGANDQELLLRAYRC